MSNNKASSKDDLVLTADLLLDIASSLMGAGSHTSRVVRNISRMATAFGYEVFITIFQKNMTMMARKKGCVESITLVRAAKHMAIDYRVVAELSELSWQTHDYHLTPDDVRKEYNRVMEAPRMSRWRVLPLVALANGSFCILFGGDFISAAVVFLATLIAFFIRQEMIAQKTNHLVMFVLCSCIASMLTALGCIKLGLGETPDIAMATSVLFLIPGVPLLNSIMDILEGHVLTGISRFVNATMLIISISIGFLITLLALSIQSN